MKSTEALKKNDMLDFLSELRNTFDGKLVAINTLELKLGKFDGKWEPWQGPSKYIVER